MKFKYILGLFSVSLFLAPITSNADEQISSQNSLEENISETLTSSDLSIETNVSSETNSSTFESNSQEETTEDTIQMTEESTPNLETPVLLADSTVTVTNETEFWSAVQDTTTSTIILGNDLLINESGKKVRKNLIIDGQNHNISYNLKGNLMILSTSANNLTISFKNINMGSDSYPNNSYYGFLTVQNSGTILNIENFTYFSSSGSQPFYANNSGTLNFIGKNSFTSKGTIYGGEFIERFLEVNFMQDSDTSVYNDTTGSLGLFYSNGSMKVNLGNNAKVQFDYAKVNFTYGNISFNLAENAKMIINRINGEYNTSNNNNLSANNTIINAEKDSELSFLSDSLITNINKVTINANLVNYVYFANKAGNTVTSSNLTLNRTDANNNENYMIDYLAKDGSQNIANSHIQINSTNSISPTYYKNGKSFLYVREPNILNNSISNNVNHFKSDIMTTIETNDDSIGIIKISDNKLYSTNDINSTNSQQEISNSSIITKAINVNKAEVIDSNVLGSKVNYIYTQLKSNIIIEGYTVVSKWIENIHTQDEFTGIEYPTTPMLFNSPMSGPFSMNNSSYLIRNSGNIPLYIKPTSLIEKDNPIKLVSDLSNKSKQEVELSINGRVGSKSEIWKYGSPMSNTLQMNPYFLDDNYSEFFISGDYSGPNIGPQLLDYTLNFEWKR